MTDGSTVSEWATFVCPDGFEMQAYVARPDRSGTWPGVLFVYEPFGINEEMQRVASELAAEGYVVMIPDLMQRGSFLRCIRRLMADLKAGAGPGIDDLLAARAALADRADVDGERLAVMGLCMGGGFALILSRTGLFRVAAPFYGATPPRLDGACPIVASYGARDLVTRNDAAHLQSEVERLGILHDVRIYPDAGHSFMTRPPNTTMRLLGPILPAHSGYVEDAAQDAKERVLAFFREHLDAT